MSRLRKILDLADEHELALYRVVIFLKDRNRSVLIRLIVLTAILLAVFNPVVIASILIPFTAEPLPDWYRMVFWGAVAVKIVMILMAAWRTVPLAAGGTDFSERSAIKGLRPFEAGDADLFKRLQRDGVLRECLQAITARDFRFGILCGTSGTGKTSFLRAGLLPALQEAPYHHRCVYVKFTDLDPEDAIRQALEEQLSVSREAAEPGDLLTLFHAASTASAPLVLLFDQFEQFFVHHRYKKDRAPFIDVLAAWYQQPGPSAVKILVAVREDFAGRLIELQKMMRYVLGPQESIRLEGFTPQETTAVFEVIAEHENLKCDRDFVEKMAGQELANPEDGLVSPVDIQILAWMIAGQRAADERAFDRTAYRKLGGVEGLLERYLARALDARATETRRQNALKVLLTLTDLDRNTRAGVLTEDALKKKLAGRLSASEVTEAVSWLARGDVRLVTPSRRDGVQGYELAHERLIPALRRLAGKELSEAEQVGLLLDRRVNEWLGNDRAARYLLTGREGRRIESQRPYLTWGPQRKQKEAFLNKSRRRRQVRVTGAVAVVILAVGAFTWWQSAPGAIWQVKRDLAQLTNDVQDASTLTAAAHAFAKAGAYDQAQAVVSAIADSSDQEEALKRIAGTAAQAGDLEKAHALTQTLVDPTRRSLTLSALIRTAAEAGALTQARQFAEDLSSPIARVWALHTIAEAAVRNGNGVQARDFLTQASTAAGGLVDPFIRARLLQFIAGTTVQVGNTAPVVEILSQTRAAVEAIPDARVKARQLGDLATVFGRSGDMIQARHLLGRAQEVADSLAAGADREAALRAIAEATVWTEGIEQAETLIDRIRDPAHKVEALCAMARAAAETGTPAQVQATLGKASAVAATFPDSTDRAKALRFIAETAVQGGAIDHVHAVLVEARKMPDAFFDPPSVYYPGLGFVPDVLVETSRPALWAGGGGYDAQSPQEKVLSVLAKAVEQAEDAAQAQGLLDEARGTATRLSRVFARSTVLCSIAETAARAGRTDLAREILAGLVQEARQQPAMSAVVDPKETLQALVETAVRIGDLKTAEEIMQQIAPSLEKIEALVFIAEALVSTDPAQARTLLTQARAIALATGMQAGLPPELLPFAPTALPWGPDALIAIARAHARMAAWRQARALVAKQNSKTDQAKTLIAILVVWGEHKNPARAARTD